MVPIICVVGRKNNGKTHLIERLIPQLQALGYRVGACKHHSHRTDLDTKGKDSWRHAQAGADAVAVLSPIQFVLFRRLKEEVAIEDVVPLLGEVDCILVEGFKLSAYPKIEVCRASLGTAEPLCTKEDQLIALVGEPSVDRGVPCFAWDELPALARLLRERFLIGATTEARDIVRK